MSIKTKYLGISRKDFIRKTGLSSAYFYSLAHGKKKPSRETMKKLHFAFDLSYAEMIG
jgi:predicted transcriptional regulator